MSSVSQTIVVLSVGVIIGLLLRLSCSEQPTTHKEYKHDTMYVATPAQIIQSPPLPAEVIRDTDTVYIPNNVDKRILHERDSLRKLLFNSGIKVRMCLDTINSRNDTLRICCDDIARTIVVNTKYAPEQRITTTITETTTVIKERNPTISVGVHTGYGFALTNGNVVSVPYLGIGLQYNLINF